MKKISFNDNFHLTQSVIDGKKTMTRRVINSDMAISNCEKGYFDLALNYAQYQVGEVVAIAQSYNDCLYDAHTECEINGRDAVLEETAGWNNKGAVKAESMLHHVKITDVHVELLQHITNKDCVKEGVVQVNDCFRPNYVSHYQLGDYTHAMPQMLYGLICGKKVWNCNPWVFVYEFELVD